MKVLMKFFNKHQGFDTLIGDNIAINGCDELILSSNTTTVIAGQLAGGSIIGREDSPLDIDLIVSGTVILAENMLVHSLTISGTVTVDGLVRCPKMLTIKKGGKLVAKTIEYTNIVVESGGQVEGQLVPIPLT